MTEISREEEKETERGSEVRETRVQLWTGENDDHDLKNYFNLLIVDLRRKKS